MKTLSERMFDAAISTLELYGVYIGTHLGLYEALRERGALTPPELSEVAGIDPRYAREWLEQQAVAGYLRATDDPTADGRRYSLPADHVGALCDPEHPEHLAPLARMLIGVAGALPEVIGAYRDGTGVDYPRYGRDFCCGQGGINRPAFTRDLVTNWLPAISDLHARLTEGARVADVGCGQGWSTIAMARAYPRSRVTGYDVDPDSITEARANARRAGVEVGFECVDADRLAERGPFDLVLIFEALHDMSRPVEVLAAVRRALGDGGALVVADERVDDSFRAPGEPLDRFLYGWSITHCLPVSMAEQPSAAIGTVIRPSTVMALADSAGYASCAMLPIDSELFRFYRLSAD